MTKLDEKALDAAVGEMYGMLGRSIDKCVEAAIRAYLAALPEPDGVKVRVAGVTDGTDVILSLCGKKWTNDEEALDWAQGCLHTYKVGGPISRSIITAYLPKPQPPAEVAGTVEDAGS